MKSKTKKPTKAGKTKRLVCDGLVRLARGPVRVRARREIAGRDFSFAKGKRLFGERDSSDDTWTVWPASDPQAFICAVGPECVRIVKPNVPDQPRP